MSFSIHKSINPEDSPHRLGGECFAVCPNCQKRFTQLAVLNLNDERLGMAWIAGAVSLIYCWRCPAAYKPLRYHLNLEGQIVIDEVNLGEPETTDFPYPDYPDTFPEVPIDLIPMSTDDEADLRTYTHLALTDGDWHGFKYSSERRTALLQPHHQVLGVPFLNFNLNSEKVPMAGKGELGIDLKCHLCAKSMFHLATICDDSFSAQPFVDNVGSQVVFFACNDCQAITALQDCD